MASVTVKNHHQEQTIPADGFFPELSLTHFQKSQRLDKNAPIELIQDCLESAIARVQRAADKWVCKQVQAGYHTLSDVPTAMIGDKSVKVRAYQAAVFMRAKGELIKHFSDYDLTEKGTLLDGKKQHLSSYHFNQSSREVRIMIDKSATRVSTL